MRLKPIERAFPVLCCGMADYLVQRIALVLWEAKNRPMAAQSIDGRMTVPEEEPALEQFMPLARKILAAIRDPSEQMIDAGSRSLLTGLEIRGASVSDHAALRDAFQYAFEAMVGADR